MGHYASMDDIKAKELASKAMGWYFAKWDKGVAILDGEYTADDLEAIAWVMRRDVDPGLCKHHWEVILRSGTECVRRCMDCGIRQVVDAE